MKREPILQSIPRNKLPKDLQKYPDLLASEMYRYRVVSRGVARRMTLEYEESLRIKYHGADHGHVAFALAPVVLFILSSATSGVIGNLAYGALKDAVKRIRRPKQEFPFKQISFESVISEDTYRRYRLEEHPGSRPLRRLPSETEQELETRYRLMVMLVEEAKVVASRPRKKAPRNVLHGPQP